MFLAKLGTRAVIIFCERFLCGKAAFYLLWIRNDQTYSHQEESYRPKNDVKSL